MLRWLENWIARDERAIERYYRDEQLVTDLELLRARARGEMGNLERAAYAARSYFAA